MKNILIVCLGNICRSPLAEAILNQELKWAKLNHLYRVDSVATSNNEVGNLTDHRTKKNARQHGIEVNHISRQITDEDVINSDWIFVVDNSNFKVVEQRFEKLGLPKQKLQLFREFDPTPGDKQIPDPWYGNEEGFETVFQMINRTAKAFVNHLEKLEVK